MNGTHLLEAALRYADRGWPVFPLAEGSKLPKISKANGGHGFHDATLDPEQISRWWTRWPRANIGIRTGPESGLVVLDVDPRHRGDESLEALIEKHGALPDTVAVRTPSGGTHHYFAWPGVELRSNAGVLDDGLDVRAAGGYVAAVPSLVARVGVYDWLNPDSQVAPLPGWLLRLLRKPKPIARAATTIRLSDTGARTLAVSVLLERAQQVATATPSRRNTTLNSAAFYLGTLAAAGILDSADIWSHLLDAALRAGLGEREIRSTIASGLSAGLANPARSA